MNLCCFNCNIVRAKNDAITVNEINDNFFWTQLIFSDVKEKLIKISML